MVMRLVRDDGIDGLDHQLDELQGNVLDDLRDRPAGRRKPRSKGKIEPKMPTDDGTDDAAAPQDDVTHVADAADAPAANLRLDPVEPFADATEAPGPTAEANGQSELPDGAAPSTSASPDAEPDEDDAGEAEVEPVNVAALEALLMSTSHPLTAGRLAELLDLSTTKPIRRTIKELNDQYTSAGRSFRIEQVAGGYQILTLPEFGDVLKRLHQKEGDAKLTKAALETLSIIAYKQPILRADVEAIRGVACGETIRSLMEKHLVKIAGRAEEPGRPILYGTTKRFLELFGLNSLKDLPQPQAAGEIKPS